jgi:hypothetical protein
MFLGLRTAGDATRLRCHLPGVDAMIEPNDWRLRKQERYLRGAEICHRTYRSYSKNPHWDHDHCEFCWQEFMAVDAPDVVRSGYSTLDGYYWICDECFDDFKDLFGWRVVANQPEDDQHGTTGGQDSRG